MSKVLLVDGPYDGRVLDVEDRIQWMGDFNGNIYGRVTETEFLFDMRVDLQDEKSCSHIQEKS
jgi:hypothetical protein